MSDTEMHGYGVRWDPKDRCWRVRNEQTGEWLLDDNGERRSWSDFTTADIAHRQFQPPAPRTW